jgi:hypothetical protein
LIAASAQDASDDKSKVTLVYDQVLPNVAGKSIRGVLVEYEPGGFSPAHAHQKSAGISSDMCRSGQTAGREQRRKMCFRKSLLGD